MANLDITKHIIEHKILDVNNKTENNLIYGQLAAENTWTENNAFLKDIEARKINSTSSDPNDYAFFANGFTGNTIGIYNDATDSNTKLVFDSLNNTGQISYIYDNNSGIWTFDTLNSKMWFNFSGTPLMMLDTTSGITIDGNITADNLTWGTYTPTLFNTTNVAASAAYLCNWTRLGDMVTVTGQVDIDVTLTATATVLGMSIPIASDFASELELSGVAYCASVAGLGAAVDGDKTNDRAQFRYISTDISSRRMSFLFTYQIL